MEVLVTAASVVVANVLHVGGAVKKRLKGGFK
jgi:hypothetical protein